MGLPVTVYRSTDAGAPVQRITKPSDVIDILKACLVNGYGTMVGAGWNLVFEDASANKAVFSNSLVAGGSGGAVQVEPHSGSNAVGATVRFTAANQITALDSYINKCGFRGFTTNFSSSGKPSKGWTVIATARSFYIIVESPETKLQENFDTNGYAAVIFIGDIESYIPNDPGIFSIATGHQSVGDAFINDYNNATFFCGGSKSAVQLFATDGATDSAGYRMSCDYSSDWLYFAPSTEFDPAVTNTPIDLQRAPLLNAGTPTASLPLCRGFIPGLFVTHIRAFFKIELPIIRTLGGDKYYFPASPMNISCVIQCSGEWYV